MWCVPINFFLLDIKIENRLKRMSYVRPAVDHLYRKAVAGDIFDGVLFCAVLVPTRCLV